VPVPDLALDDGWRIPTSFSAETGTGGRTHMKRRCTLMGCVAVAIGLLGAMPEVRAEVAGLYQAERQQALVNINTATTEQLTTLPGVGPATAARIIEYREKNGAFKKIEDLMNVRGIGEKTFLRLKPLVTVTPPKLHARPL